MSQIAMGKTAEHNWKDKTDDNQERLLRAIRIGGKWRVSAKLVDEDFWEIQDPVSEADLRGLRDVLWRKYQRKRVPWEYVVQIDAMLGDDSPEG
ncbi:MAG: hypothetical protein ACI8T1_001497 [Verrucomicrobiales bacterium]|jgi:hypothetical protein